MLFSLFFLFWFITAQTTKRCHDIGLNGWYQLIPLFFLVLFFINSQIGQKKYGHNPKGEW